MHAQRYHKSDAMHDATDVTVTFARRAAISTQRYYEVRDILDSNDINLIMFGDLAECRN